MDTPTGKSSLASRYLWNSANHVARNRTAMYHGPPDPDCRRLHHHLRVLARASWFCLNYSAFYVVWGLLHRVWCSVLWTALLHVLEHLSISRCPSTFQNGHLLRGSSTNDSWVYENRAILTEVHTHKPWCMPASQPYDHSSLQSFDRCSQGLLKISILWAFDAWWPGLVQSFQCR